MAASDTVAVGAEKGTANTKKVAAAASTNSTLVQGSPGVVYGYDLSNTAAYAVFFKFYDKATAPTVGTDTPKFVVAVAAGAQARVSFADAPIKFSNGIGYGITKAVADSDTTVTVANDLVGAVFYR